MKTTAVEWVFQELDNYYQMKGNVIKKEILKQAKEMEKQQMRSASCPYIGGWQEGEFEYWYNEKYKK